MRFTSPDPAASPFYNLHHYAGNSPARYFDPDGLEGIEFTFDGYWGRAKRYFWDHEPEFKLSFDGYTKRADATFTSAAFNIVDTATFGQYYDDTDRMAMYSMYADQGLGSYYMAGGVVGAGTFTLATAIATGGASTVTAGTGAGLTALRTASLVRTVASTTLVAQTGYTGYEAGAAVGDVMNGGEWTADTTMKVAALGLTVGGGLAGRGLGRLGVPPSVVNRGVGSRSPIGYLKDRFTGWRLGRVHRSVTKQVDRLLAKGNTKALTDMGASGGHVNSAMKGSAMGRGNVIDYIAKQRVRDMQQAGAWGFGRLTVNGSRGADFENLATGRAWDMTTRGAWGKHVGKYVHPGSPFGNRQLFPLIH